MTWLDMAGNIECYARGSAQLSDCQIRGFALRVGRGIGAPAIKHMRVSEDIRGFLKRNTEICYPCATPYIT